MRNVKQKRFLILIKSIVLLASFVGVLWAHPSAPRPALTGGFGEATCVQCHSSFPLDSGRDLGGDFSLTGVPDEYVPGETYEITAIINHPGQSRWGFELASREEGGAQAGSIERIDTGVTGLTTSGGIQYLHHTNAGTFRGLADGPVSWTFNWIAPDADIGPVYFDAAGLAANNDGGTRGDYVYFTESISVAAAAVVP
ncbi:MAG: hypothetical protein HYR55_04845 [Acidobacteria bacterium]|nr:hypothetical protein [Acidobacteriota bacterium]MBI3658704.1 hypothetical protein [Acidobacteriota bacterium]